MPELRKDPIVQRWVIIAPDRANRPVEMPDVVDRADFGFDPFAEGNEASTPPELFAFRNAGAPANGPGWRVRVIPNMFPALQPQGDLDRRSDGIYESMNGFGTHEVIVECPDNEANLCRLSVENVREVIWAYQKRMLDIKLDPRLVHALVFKNKGSQAGASIRHSHSQMIATPVVPIAIAEELQGSFQFFKDRGRSLFQEMIDQEVGSGSRVVVDSEYFLAFCPYASRFPFETWILPKHQYSHFESIPRQNVEELGQMLKTVLCKLEHALDDPPYNYVIHTAPLQYPELPYYRWHLEIFPRLTRVAGFEWGSGFYINHVPPEEAAKILRETSI
jgi:UDPglucose--hexose-1-phosphate uridylyltransferase